MSTIRNNLYIVLSFFLFSCQETAETTHPNIMQMTESVYASVTVKPENFYNSFIARPGIIQEIYVQEGDLIKKGQLLMKVAAAQQNFITNNAALTVNKAKDNYLGKTTLLANINDEIALLQKQIVIDSSNYNRQKRLWAQNIGSLSQLEGAALKLELSIGQLETLNKRFKQTELDLKNSYEQSINVLQLEKTATEDFRVKSKIDGKVYAILKEEGELIAQQEVFAQLGSSDQFMMEMSIDEVDIVRVKVEDEVIVSLDAYPAETFEARITKIYPLKEERTQTFTVECAFSQQPPILYAGLSGEANIILSRREQVLTIPADYLLEENKVMTEAGLVEVETGLQNFEYVEILAGLDTATIIRKVE